MSKLLEFISGDVNYDADLCVGSQKNSFTFTMKNPLLVSHTTDSYFCMSNCQWIWMPALKNVKQLHDSLLTKCSSNNDCLMHFWQKVDALQSLFLAVPKKIQCANEKCLCSHEWNAHPIVDWFFSIFHFASRYTHFLNDD